MNKQLRKAIENAEDKQSEADSALQKVNKYLTFHRFRDDDEPNLVMCSGEEITLEWHGGEIDKNSIIYYMEEVGYITPDDFFVS